MRQKQHILGIEELGAGSSRSKAKAIKVPTFWGILEEFLFPKQHHTFGRSQISLWPRNGMARLNLAMWEGGGKSLKRFLRKIGIINIPPKQALTKPFQMIKLIK